MSGERGVGTIWPLHGEGKWVRLVMGLKEGIPTGCKVIVRAVQRWLN